LPQESYFIHTGLQPGVCLLGLIGTIIANVLTGLKPGLNENRVLRQSLVTPQQRAELKDVLLKNVKRLKAQVVC